MDFEAFKKFLFGSSERQETPTDTGYISQSVQTEPNLIQRVGGTMKDGFDILMDLIKGEPQPEAEAVLPEPSNIPAIEGTPTPAPEYQPQNLEELIALIDRGFQNFNSGQLPVATLSGELAQSGKRLADETEGRIDPLMGAIIALKESRGGLDEKPKQNANYFNIMQPSGELADYQGNPARAINDPPNTLSFEGLLRQGGGYQNFRDTGNLADFFSRFTPTSDPLNPGIEEQINQYNKLRELFK